MGRLLLFTVSVAMIASFWVGCGAEDRDQLMADDLDLERYNDGLREGIDRGYQAGFRGGFDTGYWDALLLAEDCQTQAQRRNNAFCEELDCPGTSLPHRDEPLEPWNCQVVPPSLPPIGERQDSDLWNTP